MLRKPPVHFLLLGLLLFAGDLWRSGAFPARVRIVIPAARLEGLREEARLRGGVPPDERETKRLAAAAVEEEVLVREALRLGLDREDAVVRERLVLDLRFLGEEGSDYELFGRARELGLVEGDPMVRRRLVELMDERIAATMTTTEGRDVGEGELAAFYEEHGAEIEVPAQVRFHHVFVDGQNEEARRRAAELLGVLEHDGRGAMAGAGRGDDFVFGRDESWRSREELGKLYGGELAATIWDLPEGHWWGPVVSNWGLHLIWIDERRTARRPPLDEVREQVEERFRAADFFAARSREIQRLVRRYEIEVEAPR